MTMGVPSEGFTKKKKNIFEFQSHRNNQKELSI